MDADKMLRLVSRMYDAVLEPNYFQHMVELIDSNVDLGMIQFQAINLTNQTYGENHWSRPYPPNIIEEYRTHILPIDPRPRAAEKFFGQLVPCWQLIEPGEFDKSEIVRGWLDRKDVDRRWSAGCVWPIDRDEIAFLTALRPRREGAFGAAELSKLRAILPYVRRTAELHLKLSNLRHRTSNLAHAVDTLPHAIIVLDEARNIVSRSCAGEHLLALADGFTEKKGKLSCVRETDIKFVDRALAEAVSSHAQANDACLSFEVRRAHGRLPLRVRAVPLKPPSARISSPPAVLMLLIEDPSAAVSGPFEVLRGFGLTPAEAKLAIAIAEGQSVKLFAEDRGLSQETVRTQLKRAMHKLSVSRQVELVRKLATLGKTHGEYTDVRRRSGKR